MTQYSHGTCAICKEHNDFLMALHGEKGGPMCCLLCSGKWHGEYGRRRRLGRIVIRAMISFMDGGGPSGDIDKLKNAALFRDWGDNHWGTVADPLGYLAGIAKTKDEVIELTSEVLDNTIKLVHPDCHPPERKELATLVSAQLIALKPFVFPAPIPKPPPAPSSNNGYATASREPTTKPSRFPCVDCAATIPCFYCTNCKAEWDKQQKIEREREEKKHRRQLEKRRERRAIRSAIKSARCVVCRKWFKGKRKDARFCSDACRQKAHRDPSQIDGSTRAQRPSIRDPKLIRYPITIRDGKLFAGENELKHGNMYIEDERLRVRSSFRDYDFRAGHDQRIDVPIDGRTRRLNLHMCSDCEGLFASHYRAQLCDPCAKAHKDKAAAKARANHKAVTDGQRSCEARAVHPLHEMSEAAECASPRNA